MSSDKPINIRATALDHPVYGPSSGLQVLVWPMEEGDTEELGHLLLEAAKAWAMKKNPDWVLDDLTAGKGVH